MKRLLLISYGFPPVSRVQSLGAASLASGLASRGWEVHVLTVADPPTFLLDQSLADRLPRGIFVHTAYSLEPTRVLQLLRRARRRPPRPQSPNDSEPILPRSYTSLPAWAVRFFRSMFFPDEKVGWTPWAVRRGLQLHRHTPFDAIVSTGPPYTAHGIGQRLAAKTGIPWVAVLMDPIVGCYAFPPASPLHALRLRRFEAAVASQTAAIATATKPWADELVERNPACRDRVLVLPNGFDPRELDDAPAPAAHEGFLVSYVGTFQLSIRPDTFLDAVVALRKDPALASDLRVRFVGPHDTRTNEAIKARGLETVVERTGLVSHLQALSQMREADVLLFVLGPERESRGILSGKLPEYLACGAMILALAPEGVATDAVRRSGAGIAAAPGDIGATIEALRKLHGLWRSRQPLRPDPEVVAEFNRDRSLDRLDTALSALASEGARRNEGL